MSIAIIVAGVLLAATGVMALIRAERGPSMLDRTIALDIITSTIVGAIALEAAWSRRIDAVPLLVVLSLVGFVGSVTIARFAAVEPEGEGRVLTREEVAALDAERLAAEEAERIAGREAEEAAVDDEHHGGPAQGEVKD